MNNYNNIKYFQNILNNQLITYTKHNFVYVMSRYIYNNISEWFLSSLSNVQTMSINQL